MSKSKKNKNNWTELNKIRSNFLKSETEIYPYYSGLNLAWEILANTIYSGEQFGQDEPIVKRFENERLADSPFDAFRYYMDIGIYPPPELLIWLNDRFTEYFMGFGEVSLEEVVFGKPKPSVGNAAARASRSNFYKRFSYKINLEKLSAKHQDRKPLSMDKLAEEMFLEIEKEAQELDDGSVNSFVSPDIDNFLRGYRRWRNKSDK